VGWGRFGEMAAVVGAAWSQGLDKGPRTLSLVSDEAWMAKFVPTVRMRTQDSRSTCDNESSSNPGYTQGTGRARGCRENQPHQCTYEAPQLHFGALHLEQGVVLHGTKHSLHRIQQLQVEGAAPSPRSRPCR
jgi:hypothetical protein